MTHLPSPKIIVGAYPLYPADTEGKNALIQALDGAYSIDGLEIPLMTPAAALWWPDSAPSHWQAVVTGIPATMDALTRNPLFGLASPDPAGRAAALDMARHLNAEVGRLAAHGVRIGAIELHSAPTQHASKDAFLQSLRDIAAWDWKGASLVVEHCDAWIEGQEPSKGFLSLADELSAVQEINPSLASPMGVSLNWGRSAIETRSSAGPLAHVQQAAHSGLLRGLIFSSVSSEATDFGPPWIDMHLPPQEVHEAPDSTLLNAQAIQAAVNAAGKLDFVGFKIGLRPTDVGIAAKVEGLGQALRCLPAH